MTMWLCTSRSQRSGTKKPGILGMPAGGGALLVPGSRGTMGMCLSPSARRGTFGSGACAAFGSGACARRCRSKLTLRGQPRSCTPSSIFLALVASRVHDISTRPRSASPSEPWKLARTTRTSSTRPYGSNMSRCAGHGAGHGGGAGSKRKARVGCQFKGGARVLSASSCQAGWRRSDSGSATRSGATRAGCRVGAWRQSQGRCTWT